MREFGMSELKQMKEYLDVISQKVNSAINYRQSLLPNLDSNSKLEDSKTARIFSPNDFYYFKNFDRAVELVRGGLSWINLDGTSYQALTRVKDKHYHIGCYNFVPDNLVPRPSSISVRPKQCLYGDFDNFDVALHWYYKFVIECMQTNNFRPIDYLECINVQGELF